MTETILRPYGENFYTQNEYNETKSFREALKPGDAVSIIGGYDVGIDPDAGAIYYGIVTEVEPKGAEDRILIVKITELDRAEPGTNREAVVYESEDIEAESNAFFVGSGESAEGGGVRTFLAPVAFGERIAEAVRALGGPEAVYNVTTLNFPD